MRYGKLNDYNSLSEYEDVSIHPCTHCWRLAMSL